MKQSNCSVLPTSSAIMFVVVLFIPFKEDVYDKYK